MSNTFARLLEKPSSGLLGLSVVPVVFEFINDAWLVELPTG